MTNSREQQGFPTLYVDPSFLRDGDGTGCFAAYDKQLRKTDIPYVPAALLAEAVREARRAAFEEAAEFCQSPDITDERTLRVMAILRAIMLAKATSTECGKGGGDV